MTLYNALHSNIFKLYIHIYLYISLGAIDNLIIKFNHSIQYYILRKDFKLKQLRWKYCITVLHNI